MTKMKKKKSLINKALYLSSMITSKVDNFVNEVLGSKIEYGDKEIDALCESIKYIADEHCSKMRSELKFIDKIFQEEVNKIVEEVIATGKNGMVVYTDLCDVCSKHGCIDTEFRLFIREKVREKIEVI